MTGTPTYEVRRVGQSYAVFNGNGLRVSGFYHSEDRATTRLEKLVEGSAGDVRPCITCRAKFKSQGAHNRMCDPCRKRSMDLPPEALFPSFSQGGAR